MILKDDHEGKIPKGKIMKELFQKESIQRDYTKGLPQKDTT